MKLHENKELFNDAILATSQQKNIPAIYVEKDYWVTMALHIIYSADIGRETVFKGGTSLSKCYNLIERFSEDIDLVVLRKEGESNNHLKTKIKNISQCVGSVIPEIKVAGITHKKGMIRKTAHNYEKVFQGKFGQIRNNIIIESTWLGHYEPYQKSTVVSYISEMLTDAGRGELIEEYELYPFEVLVLSKERTFCEKIMSLVRFSQTDNAINDLNNKVRHTYDLHIMLNDKDISQFFYSDNFEKMLLKVANDDVYSFKNNNDWLKNHPSSALIFSDTKATWDEIKQTYLNVFKDLVFGEFPDEKEILDSLLKISSRLSEIEWGELQHTHSDILL